MVIRITYPCGVVQTLTQVEQSVYNEMRNHENEVIALEVNKKENREAIENHEHALKSFDWLKEMVKAGKCFTTESPVGKAVHNGGLLELPQTQGGTHKCDIEIIEG
jgi:hypothetical protein